ncbi:hypothetical protein A5637_16965 [Mycolicibacterium fortuitum]|nr:hypothetical protein A5668_29760 [Mycolicibacterium fortuitum]OBK02470.1 hypothetical protein A5637_16965 [Mycolicibacterium fortuitum]
MNSTEDARAVPVTARTEYLTSRHRVTAIVSGTAFLSGLAALVALNYAGVSGLLTAVVVASLVTIALGAVSYGRLGKPGAVLITVDGRTVWLGDENGRIVSYPLSSLIAVNRAGPAEHTTTSGRLLTVRGQQYLTLTFATDAGSEEWRVAVIGSDPAAAEILSRLESTLPAAELGAEPPVSGARIADAGTDDAAERLWEEASRRHNDILATYGAYELDPAMLLRYPAITDVTVESTQTFHVALDEAAALRTERYPGKRGLADAYQQAVVSLRRAWIACESHGKKVGTSYLGTTERGELDTALKLYNHATSSTTPAEQATYYGRVREIVTKLVDRGVLHPPKVQLAQLEGVTRRAIEAARPD